MGIFNEVNENYEDFIHLGNNQLIDFLSLYDVVIERMRGNIKVALNEIKMVMKSNLGTDNFHGENELLNILKNAEEGKYTPEALKAELTKIFPLNILEESLLLTFYNELNKYAREKYYASCVVCNDVYLTKRKLQLIEFYEGLKHKLDKIEEETLVRENDELLSMSSYPNFADISSAKIESLMNHSAGSKFYPNEEVDPTSYESYLVYLNEILTKVNMKLKDDSKYIPNPIGIGIIKDTIEDMLPKLQRTPISNLRKRFVELMNLTEYEKEMFEFDVSRFLNEYLKSEKEKPFGGK